nr:hypothetical protein [Saccharopolyspora elongata]
MLPIRVDTGVPGQRFSQGGDRVGNPLSMRRHCIPALEQPVGTCAWRTPDGRKEIARRLDSAERARLQADTEGLLDTRQKLSECQAIEPEITLETTVQRRGCGGVSAATLRHKLTDHGQQ